MHPMIYTITQSIIYCLSGFLIGLVVIVCTWCLQVELSYGCAEQKIIFEYNVLGPITIWAVAS